MTNIAALPGYTADIAIRNDEDWVSALAYADDGGVPLALDGILITLTVRPRLGDPRVSFYGSTTDGTIAILPVTTGGPLSVWAILVPYLDAQGRPAWPPFLGPGSYVFGVQAIADGESRTLLSGALTVTQGVP